ncbi:zinc finger protein, partial [Aphelenchoides avenae]
MNSGYFPNATTSDFLDDDFKFDVEGFAADDEQKPSPSTPSKQRKDRRKQVCMAPTTCLICGKATGHRHYNVPSCHACKAFFRRSLLQAKNYRCASGTKDCQVWKGARCKSCRLDRCIVTGMDPSAIVTEAVKELDKATLFYVSYRNRLTGGHDKKCVS